MKIDEFKLVCPVLVWPPPEGVVNPHRSVILGRKGPVKCRNCDYWPIKADWLENGLCTTCDYRVKKQNDLSETFKSREPETCMGCGDKFVGLHISGYCRSCRVTLEEAGMEVLSKSPIGFGGSRAMSRIPQDATRSLESVQLPKFPCIVCLERKATVGGGTCMDCENDRKNPPTLVSFDRKADGTWVEKRIPLTPKVLDALGGNALGVDARLGGCEEC